MKYSTGRHDIKLSKIFFKDKDTSHIICYVPSLDLTGYGPNKKDAEEMVDHSVGEFLKPLKTGDLHKKLKKLGFTNSIENSHGYYNFKEPVLPILIANNKDLYSIVSRKSYERKFRIATIFI